VINFGRSGSQAEQLNDRLVMVGRFLDPSEAQMAKGMLESAGIECFLQGENANAIVPLAFRVRLTVRYADEETARVLLADVELAG
jgi:hypothetical protein